MKKTTAILIVLAAMLATYAAVSMNRIAVAQGPSEQSGIWVSGEGALSVPPDLAMLDFGVDVFASDFNAAHSKASDAMDAMIAELNDRGVSDEDIQATEFSVHPVEDEVEGRKTLIGYRVSNSATAKLRDTGAVRIVIYEMIAAGGGGARIDGIGFTLEDPNSKRDEVLALAIADAEERAERVAGLTDVEVGELIYISEGALTYTTPAVLAGSTGGNVKLSLSVEAAFAIMRDTAQPTATPTPTSEPTAVPTPTATPDTRTKNEMTRDYVERAIKYYDANGRDATIAHYNDPASIEGERVLYLIDTETLVIVASPIRQIRGVQLTEGMDLVDELRKATEQGHFFDRLWINVATGQQEPTRFLMVLHDGLVFASAHLIVKENVADTTKEYINRATKYYDDHGLDAMVAHYNTRESFDGQLYLFMMDENDIYLVHPFIPRLIGTDIKDLPNKDLNGNPLGVEIAKATEAGIWVEYMWPNPLTFKDEKKVTWAIRHDGKIFASGYYTGSPDDGTPPWATTPPREYTVQYVDKAIERYQEFGLESVKAYYNSVASFEGEFYLFATDPDDIYNVHPLIPNLIGTDIKDVVDADTGFELGKELAKATNEQGVWVEYNWPHPKTGMNAPKVSYAKRHDGYLFATGYYPLPADPEAATREYIRKAIDLYESDGLAAMMAHYNSRDSIDGQWYLYVIDWNEKFIVSGLSASAIGADAADLKAADGAAAGSEMLKATEEGHKFSYRSFNFQGAGEMWLNSVAIRHGDGLIFVSGYHTALPDYTPLE